LFVDELCVCVSFLGFWDANASDAEDEELAIYKKAKAV
jgi:hypothetical protein